MLEFGRRHLDPVHGKRSGVIRWPEQFAEEKLTFQAIVVSGTRSLRLRAPVTVQLP